MQATARQPRDKRSLQLHRLGSSRWAGRATHKALKSNRMIASYACSCGAPCSLHVSASLAQYNKHTHQNNAIGHNQALPSGVVEGFVRPTHAADVDAVHMPQLDHADRHHHDGNILRHATGLSSKFVCFRSRLVLRHQDRTGTLLLLYQLTSLLHEF